MIAQVRGRLVQLESARFARMPMDLARRRLAQQHLGHVPHARPEDAVGSLLAVQSQDFSGAKWAVAQRTRGSNDADVQRAFDAGRIVRTHVLRPTWHFVAPADLRWLLELTAPRVHAVNAYYYHQHGMDAALVKRSNARIVKALSRGTHLTRTELGRALGELDAGVSGNRLAYMLMRAELDGLICSGTMRGKQHTYALLEERVPLTGRLRRDEALAEIARRYVSGHGPAQAQDLAWWSGLTVADARRGLETCGAALERAVLDGKTYWLPPAAPSGPKRAPSVHLLPNYDELIIAFKDRSAALDPCARTEPGVLTAHFVVVNGRIVGGWRRTFAKNEVVITARLLRPLTKTERAGVERAAARYAQSLGVALRIEMADGRP
jgi:hypothetical protein